MLFYVQTNISYYPDGVVPVFLVIADDFICLIFSVTTHKTIDLYVKITYKFHRIGFIGLTLVLISDTIIIIAQ